MKFSELPKEYQLLERGFECPIQKNEDNLACRFTFKNTPEGFEFWVACYNARNISELPPLSKSPISLLSFIKDKTLLLSLSDMALNSIVEGMREAVEYHNKRALQAAYDNAKMVEVPLGDLERRCFMTNDWGEGFCLDEKSILEAYPKSEIV